MGKLKEILKETLDTYTGRALIGTSYLTASTDDNFFTVTTVAENTEKRVVNHSLTVRIESDLIIIEEDINNKPLVDALVQNGIDRKHIILAYAGESIPITG